MESSKPRRIYLYVHYGGSLVVKDNKSVEYDGGVRGGALVVEGMTAAEVVSICCKRFDLCCEDKKVWYTLRFDRSMLMPLVFDACVREIIEYNEEFGFAYIAEGNVEVLKYDELQSLQVLSNNPSRSISDAESSKWEGNDLSYSNDLVDKSYGVQMGVRSAVGVARIGASSGLSTVLTGVGQIFENADAFRSNLYKYSVACEFRYKWVRNRKDRLFVICAIDDCPFSIKAYAIPNTAMVKIRTFEPSHRHNAGQICQLRKPPFSSKLLGGLIVGKLSSTPNYTPNQVRKDIESEMGIQINYIQGWNAVEKAKTLINGDPNDHYKLLDWMFHHVKKSNPGSVAFVVTEDDRFSQLFISFATSIQGFMLGCRSCIFVDAGHLSGPFSGTMLSACSSDADNKIFPLAIAIVGSENYENWSWFLKELKVIIRAIEVVILSDSHQGIISSVAEIFGEENHCYCLRHLKENFSTELTKLGITRRQMKDYASQLFDAVAYANTEVDFNLAMCNLRAFNTKLAEWVMNTKPEHWARSKFPKARWSWMNSNIAESFNAWLKNERLFSIPSFLLAYFDKLATKHLKVKSELCRWQTPIGPSIEKILYANFIKRSSVIRSIRYAYLVFKVEIAGAQLSVDLDLRICSCGEWQLTGIPCSHACYVLE